MVYKCFDKKAAVTYVGTAINSNSGFENQQFGEELYKTVIRMFEKRKVYSSFKDTIWRADLPDMQLISNKCNKKILFLLCVVDIFSKYALVALLKDEKCIRIINAFQKFLDDFSRKPYKMWVAKGSKICKKPM